MPKVESGKSIRKRIVSEDLKKIHAGLEMVQQQIEATDQGGNHAVTVLHDLLILATDLSAYIERNPG
jgi:hypothetical protein